MQLELTWGPPGHQENWAVYYGDSTDPLYDAVVQCFKAGEILQGNLRQVQLTFHDGRDEHDGYVAKWRRVDHPGSVLGTT